ncbi:conserved Plasmodium protein, unknown function [Plasmodium gallinaceum]|uniref:Proteasome assembly chaperone 4 n=1 Tax=Plasmodium gallinaceum TaxID=5849 RepID=A0A1J1GPL1_PLAGA|nr:conserved Plasmodium protein, unknown function [Plasmodium gallinaceum]CRG94439.1 conserved Plasmodium protein, unknown function [Plasmodium gallinaceum]
MNEPCEYSENYSSTIQKGKECNVNVEIYRYHKIYMSYLNLYFCVIDFNETMFISVSDENNELNDLQASYPLKYEDADNTVCLVGEPNSYGNDVARLLGKKFKIPFYVSVNVDESDENLTNFIFSSCLDILKPIFENR